MKHFTGLFALAPFLGIAFAQVSSTCDPLQKSNCPTDPGFNTNYTFNFNTTPSYELWEATVGSVQYSNDTGAAFTINKQGDSPTIRTTFYIFFGSVEILMKAAPGQGIVSSAMLLSDDLDEIDLEFIGVNTTTVSTNYYGKGVLNYDNAGVYPTPGDNQQDYHNYTIVWTKEETDWYIDGTIVRTLTAASANQTLNYPQTPMRLSLGIWAGGDPNLPAGTRQWAGGNADYANGPYSMYVQSVRISDFGGGKGYTYGDQSGTWQSIKVVEGNSTALAAIEQQQQPPKESISERWNNLPAGAKIGVYCAIGGVVAASMGSLIFYCIKQRRVGAMEARNARLEGEMSQMERMQLDQIKREDADADSDYDSRSVRHENTIGIGAPPAAVNPLDRSWDAIHIESPLQSPVSSLSKDVLGGFRQSTAPAESSTSPDSRISSLPPSQQAPQRAQSPGPLAQVRNFSSSFAGYKGLPGGEI